MPLVVLSGRPCVGKSRVASRLAAQLQEAGKRVHVVNVEALGISRRDGYKDAPSEKMTRGALKAAAERLLTDTDVVILDSLNYVKGFRYEMYCVARSVGTSYCVIFVDAGRRVCSARNAARAEADCFPAEAFETAWSQYETPDERNRWDSPLFTIFHHSAATDQGQAGSPAALPAAAGGSGPAVLASSFIPAASPSSFQPAAASSFQPAAASSFQPAAASATTAARSQATDATTAEDAADGVSGAAAAGTAAEDAADDAEFDEQATAICHAAAEYLEAGTRRRPGRATVLCVTAHSDVVQELERVVSDITARLVERLPSATPGDAIPVPHASAPVLVRRQMAASELRRLQRQYTSFASVRIPKDALTAAVQYVAFLNAALAGHKTALAQAVKKQAQQHA